MPEIDFDNFSKTIASFKITAKIIQKIIEKRMAGCLGHSSFFW